MRYAELYCKTNFSFQEGASHPDELAGRAAELGYTALAVTDRNSLAGVVRAHVAAKAAGLKLLIGAEITPVDAPPVLLYATDRRAYGRLAQLITVGRRAAPKGDCRLTFADIAEHADGLLAAVWLPLGRTEDDDARDLARYRHLFGRRCHLAAALHRGPNDDAVLDRLQGLARAGRIPLVATNAVHYHDPDRRPLHDVLTAIKHGVTVTDLGAHRFPNAERHLKPPAEMAGLFHRCPRALHHAVELAEQCHFSLDELRYEYPEEICPPDTTPEQHLANLTWAGARERYPAGVPGKVADLVRHELSLIADLHYEAYFLTVWDLVRFARGQGILCQGRGSAANSAVCYCLGVTSVDPDRTDVLFERFVSRERQEAPDIDIDFEHERREEVIQYIYQKYGRDRAGLTAEVISYRPRSAVRDVGKALGLSLDAVGRLAKNLGHHCGTDNLAERTREAGLDPAAPGVAQLLSLASTLQGFPRHLSQHVGGFVITRGPLSELVPVENAAMPDRTVIEWDKDDLDALGILKVDCLGLGMLTALRKCFTLIDRHDGRPLTLADVPAEDPDVYEMMGRADTVGVFQIESRAQMSMLPRLLPRCFYDLVVEVAIVRPGPIQGGMIHPYLRRRNGQEPVTYPSKAVEEILAKTLGVPIFQEQVMRLAMVAAGFTAGEADQLRRAMGAWRRPGLIEQYRSKLRDGMVARGLPASFAEQLYEQIRGFGEYGFPESHAASFALLSYISAWLKHHYPAAFTAALLNSQPMGFYAPAQLVRDAQDHGVAVRPVDVNHSEWDCTLEEEVATDETRMKHGSETNIPAPSAGSGGTGISACADSSLIRVSSVFHPWLLRLGFRLIRSLAEDAAKRIAVARAERPFRSVLDFTRRTGLTRAVAARLAAADAFGSLGLTRREAFWHVLATGDELPLFAGTEAADAAPPLPAMPLGDQVVADYDSVGLSLKAHPLDLVRPELDRLKAITAAALTHKPDKAVVRVAGLVLVRQQPGTAKGTTFITLEDETGTSNLVVWPKVWERYRTVARGAVALLAQGTVQRTGRVVYVAPTRIDDLSETLEGIASRSRDFR